VIAVDLGGVLVDVDRQLFWRVVPSSQVVEVQQALQLHHPRLQCGEVEPEAFVDAIAAAAHQTSAEILAAWSAMVQWRPGAIAAIEGWSQQHEVELWSNIDVIHVHALSNRRITARWVTSCEVGCCKPEDGFFRAALRDRSPSTCRFFDDQPANVAAANHLGIIATCIDDFRFVTTPA
jgi:HAD superfamily hydrolase (TIGR01509 family)